MADRSAIEWTEATWNPVTGCDRISAGCEHCYAMTLAKRLKAMGSAKYQNDGDPRTSGPGFDVAIHPESLDEPYRWRQSRVVFVNSMSDLFHARVPVSFIRDVFDVCRDTPHHTYQVLTKRSLRLLRVAEKLDWPSNLWMGVSVVLLADPVPQRLGVHSQPFEVDDGKRDGLSSEAAAEIRALKRRNAEKADRGRNFSEMVHAMQRRGVLDRFGLRGVGDRGAHRLLPSHALPAMAAHEPLHSTSRTAFARVSRVVLARHERHLPSGRATRATAAVAALRISMVCSNSVRGAIWTPC